MVSVDQGDSARGWSSWCAKGLREELLRLRLVLGASARPSFSWSKVCLKHLKSLGGAMADEEKRRICITGGVWDNQHSFIASGAASADTVHSDR